MTALKKSKHERLSGNANADDAPCSEHWLEGLEEADRIRHVLEHVADDARVERPVFRLGHGGIERATVPDDVDRLDARTSVSGLSRNFSISSSVDA